jgi:hypothetical protein
MAGEKKVKSRKQIKEKKNRVKKLRGRGLHSSTSQLNLSRV